MGLFINVNHFLILSDGGNSFDKETATAKRRSTSIKFPSENLLSDDKLM